MSDCVFCDKIANFDYDGHQLGVVWFEPRHPCTPGHTLFVPLQHVRDANEWPDITGVVMRVAAGRVTGDGNWIWNVGPDAGQTVWHAHLHWVPRRPGDGLHLPWTGQVKGGETGPDQHQP